MNRLITCFLALWLAVFLHAASYTSTGGTAASYLDWNTDASWTKTGGGTGHPISGDGVSIRGGDHIAANGSCACASITIGTTQNNPSNDLTHAATLQVNGTLSMDSAATLKVGQGANRDGAFIGTAGGSIVAATGSVQFIMNNGWCQTSGTTACTAAAGFTFGNLTTALTFAVPSGVTDPAQDWNLQYVRFLANAPGNGSNFVISGGSGSPVGAATPKFILNHFVMIGTKQPTFGSLTTNVTPSTAPIRISNGDVRDLTATRTIFVYRTGSGGADCYIDHCTFSQSDTNRITITPGCSDLVVSNCFGKQTLGQEATTGTIVSGKWRKSAFTTNSSSSSMITMTVAGSSQTCEVSDCYFYSTSAGGTNLHPINENGTGGSGTHNIWRNVMDCLTVSGQTPDFYQPGGTSGYTVNADLSGNVVVVAGEIANGSHHPDWSTGTTFLAHNNTLNGTISALTVESGDIFRPEGAANPGGGNMTIRSTLMKGNGKASEFAVEGATTATVQTIGYVNYNDYWNVDSGTTFLNGTGGGSLTISAGNTTKANADPNPGSNYDPYFVDAGPTIIWNGVTAPSTRTMDTWNLFFGTGTNNRIDCENYFLGMNGYNDTNKDQSGTPTAYVPYDMLTWVRYGSSPTNVVLHNAAYTGEGDIGAMPVQTKTSGMFF